MANFSALKTAIQNAIRQNGNEEITGDVLQQILLSVVNTMGDGAINTIEQNLSNETLARQNADTQLQNAINAIKANIDNGYVYAGIATPSSTPVSGKVFYVATAAGIYTNFGGQVLTQGINILRYNGSSWSHQQLIGIDDVPTVASNSLVKSGGVQNELALGAVYDVSAKNPTAGPNNDGKWESLSALLSDANLNTLIPTAYRKGGMSVKFVQSSDNKYVQYRLMLSSFSTDTNNWAICDDDVLVENPEFVYIEADSEGKVHKTIEKGGKETIYDDFEIKGNSRINKDLDVEEHIKCNDLETAAYNEELNESSNYKEVECDSEGKIHHYIKNNGVHVFPAGVEFPEPNNTPQIVKVNCPDVMLGKIEQSKKTTTIDGGYPAQVAPVNILHFSDIHQSERELKRIIEFYNYYAGYIDTILHTGDNVSKFADDFSFWTNTKGSEYILNCIGNHDPREDIGGVTDWRYHVGQDCYNKFFSGRIQYWGVTYEAGKCYYYKDYTAQNLRLIVLDDNLLDNYTDETSWLNGLLNDALANNLHVVIASHTAKGGDITQKVINPITEKIVSFSSYNGNAEGGYPYTDACDLVSTFISNGGKFVCWLVGHAHRTDLGFSQNYPNQIQVVADIAYAQRTCNDVIRSTNGGNTTDSFHIISIDTQLGLFKLLKVGTNYDKILRNRNIFVYDYVNKNVISDNGILI